MSDDAVVVAAIGLVVLIVAGVGFAVWLRSRQAAVYHAGLPTAIDDQPPVAESEGRPRTVWRIGISAVGIVTAAAFLIGLASWLPHTLLAPFVAPQHIERVAAGFAIDVPLDWEYVDGADADPEAWWDREVVGDVHAHHERFLAEGGVIVARTRSPFISHFCSLYDSTDAVMAPPAWTSLAHVPSDAQAWESLGETVVGVETVFLDLPAGQVVRADVAWDDGWNQSSYYYNLGARWFRLDCGAREDLPEDRWLSIAETFEFLASPSSTVPHLPPQRIERPEAGFAVTLPWQWQHVDAADADPDVWWDAEIDGGPAAYHEEQLASGLLLMARAYLPNERSLQSCYVEDFTGRAAMPPAWTSLGDARLDLLSLRENPDVVTADATNLDLPSGPAVRMDVVWEEGGVLVSSYYFVDGTTWFVLSCGTSGEPPEDRWLSVAESFEFLPADG